MKQEVLAEALGYRSRVSISHIETGREDLPLLKVFALAEALGVPPHELFLERVQATPASTTIEPLPLAEQALLRLWQSLPDADRQTLQRCAELLASGEADIRRHLSGQLRLIAETVEARALKRGSEGAGAGDPVAG